MLGLVALGVLVSVVSVQSDPNSPNYFVDGYQGGLTYYPYPIDICLKNAVLGGDYVTYSCINDTAVKRTKWDSDTCSSVYSEAVFTTADTQANGIYDFNCGGVTSYAEILVCTGGSDCDACTGYGSTTFTTPGVCNYGTDEQSLLTLCNDTSLETYFYANNETVCFDDTVNETETTLWSTSDECEYYGASSIGDVYARVVSCVLNGSLPATTTAGPTTSGAGGDESSTTEEDSSSNENTASTIYNGGMVIGGLVHLLVALLFAQH